MMVEASGWVLVSVLEDVVDLSVVDLVNLVDLVHILR